jgi:hypothetical protein
MDCCRAVDPSTPINKCQLQQERPLSITDDHSGRRLNSLKSEAVNVSTNFGKRHFWIHMMKNNMCNQTEAEPLALQPCSDRGEGALVDCFLHRERTDNPSRQKPRQTVEKNHFRGKDNGL